MASLTVAGLDLEIQTSGAKKNDPIIIGQKARAFNGNHRSTVRALKHRWSFLTKPLTFAEADTLRIAIGLGSVVVGGELVENRSFDADVVIKEETPIKDDSQPFGYQLVMALEIEEA